MRAYRSSDYHSVQQPEIIGAGRRIVALGARKHRSVLASLVYLQQLSLCRVKVAECTVLSDDGAVHRRLVLLQALRVGRDKRAMRALVADSVVDRFRSLSWMARDGPAAPAPSEADSMFVQRGFLYLNLEVDQRWICVRKVILKLMILVVLLLSPDLILEAGVLELDEGSFISSLI